VVELEALLSPDPRRRFRQLTELRHNYEPEVGEALVQELITELEPGVWWLAVTSVLPIWLPALDRRLVDLQRWPFSSAQTLRVLQLAGGHVLHSAEDHLERWIASGEWEFRFAGFRWLCVGGTMERACREAHRINADLSDGIAVNAEIQALHPWMTTFYDVEERRREVQIFLANNDS
jgi:hypothetical protein